MWKQLNISLDNLNNMCLNTHAEAVGIKITEVGNDFLCASMPVDHRTHQPLGLLHGGASAALAETVGSIASWLCIDPEKQMAVGIEINCNHVRGKKNGIVTATARPLHIGTTTHVWDIKITDERDHLICVSRLTVSVLNRKDQKAAGD